MAFCKACGAEVGGAAFCPKCGASQGISESPQAPVAAGGVSTDGIVENVAGVLCYAFGWVSGLIFLLIDRRSFVRFHAIQSIAFNIAIVGVWIAYWIVSAILTAMFAAMHSGIGFLSFFLWPLIFIGIIVTWIILMYKAYNHEKFKLPIIGGIVERMVR